VRKRRVRKKRVKKKRAKVARVIEVGMRVRRGMRSSLWRSMIMGRVSLRQLRGIYHLY
jgi:hypothetical protein